MHEIEVETVDDTIEQYDTEQPQTTTDVRDSGFAEAEHSERTIIGLCGMPSCGKSTVVNFANTIGVQSTSMGDVVRSVADNCDTDPWSAAQNLRGKCETEIARRTRGVVSRALDDDGIVLVDGLRTEAEASYYRDQFDATFVLVDVFCDTSTRLDRYQHRENVDFDAALTELGERDERELNVGLGRLLDESDATIYNDFETTYTDVCGQVERLITNVSGGN